MIYSNNYGVCQVCKERKGHGNHSKCSRILQKRHNEQEWANVISSQNSFENKQTVRKASTQLIRRKNHFEGYQGD